MSVRKNLIYNIINNVAAVIFPFITVPYISRVLGVENIGLLGFSYSFASYFCIVANLGINLYGAKEIAKLKNDPEKRSKLFSELFFIMLISSIICSIVYLIVIFTVGTLYKQLDYLLISGTIVFLSAFSLDWFFNGRENFKMITIRSVLVKLIALILMFLFVHSPKETLIYCAILAFSTFANNLWNFIYILKKEVKVSFYNLYLKQHVKPLLILFSTTLAVSVYTTLDTIMLGFLKNYTEVGYFNSAVRVSRLLLPLAVATTAVMIPKISYAFTLDDKTEYNHYLARSFSLMSFMCIPMAVGLFIITPSFVPIFFGDKFSPVTPILQIQSIIFIFVGINNFFGLLILAVSNLELKLLYCIVIGAVVNFILNLIFIPYWGAIGASIMSVFAECIIMIITFFMVLHYTKVRVKWWGVWESVISCMPMLIFYCTLPKQINNYLNLIILMAFGIISYALIQYYIFKNQIAHEIKGKLLTILKF